MKFKAALVQEKSMPMDVQGNTDRGLEIVFSAKKLGADVVLFPECWITGYAFPTAEGYDEWYDGILYKDSPYIKAFCSAALKNDINIVITALTKQKNSGKPRNSALVIDRSGQLLMQYDKVHTCDFSDERILESGEGFKVCELDGVKIGIMICYDREYPESARVLMLKGAEVILVPNDCGSMKPRVQALSTRAYENMVGVAMANPPGENAGCSCAFSPIVWDREGVVIENTLVLADEKTEGIFVAEFDMDAIRAYRSREMLGDTFRKVGAYADLLKGKELL